MKLKIATWNINSVRLRRSHVEKLIELERPQVICLQEIKCRDAEFPGSTFRSLGYNHQAIAGQKGYHGVAVLSQLPLANIYRRDFCNIDEARHLSVSFETGNHPPITLHNFYVPAGGDVPDRDQNKKFAHKLDFLDELSLWIENERLADCHAILVGDLNIAPFENDVWNHKALLKVVSHTPIEVEKLIKAFQSGPWHDAMRHFVPDSEKLYTWWSYRSADWATSDRGRRLDHIWVSASLKPKLKSMRVIKVARSWQQPSDHAPVVVEIDI